MDKKTNVRKTLLILIVLLAAAALLCVLYKPLYCRIYPGDRIKGVIELKIDGQPVNLSGDDLYCISFANGDKIKADSNDNKTEIAVKGGNYGKYAFGANIPGVDTPLQIEVMHGNWWEVTKFYLTLDIDTKANKVTCSDGFSILSENGSLKCGKRKVKTNDLDSSAMKFHYSTI